MWMPMPSPARRWRRSVFSTEQRRNETSREQPEDRSMRKLGSIVVGIDFSDSSRAALGHAARIADWSGAALHAVHIVDTGDHPNQSAGLTPLQREIRAGLRDEAQHRWAGFAHDAGATDQLPLDVGDGSRLGGIYQRVLDRRADLLVLGAIGHGRPHVVLGSTAEKVLRDSLIAVWACKPAARLHDDQHVRL
jgi:nucleotide-binding universal stress UspA family protein